MGAIRTKAPAAARWSKALNTTSPTHVERRLDEYASGRSDPRRLDRASTGLASRPTKSPGAGFTLSLSGSLPENPDDSRDGAAGLPCHSRVTESLHPRRQTPHRA